MNWYTDRKWRKVNVSKDIYMMRDHNWAFAAWEIALLKGKINKGSILVHVDAHLDDVPDGLYVEGILDNIGDEKDALLLASSFDYSIGESPKKPYLKIDNFIWPSIIRGTIDHTFQVTSDKQRELTIDSLIQESKNKIDLDRNRGDIVDVRLAKFISSCSIEDKKIYRTKSVEEFFENQKSLFDDVSRGRTLILDLDLDYFTVNKGDKIVLKDEKIIIDEMRRLQEINWNLVTVALSPIFCGGVEQCEYLLSLFNDNFSIKQEDLLDW